MELNTNEECLDSQQKAKTLVVILTWLGATPDAVDKYKDLYLSERYDTYVYYPTLKDFLWPKSGIESCIFVLNELKKKCQEKRKLIIHSFSIGCYIYSLMVWQMNLNPQKYGVIWNCISAQIFDSPVIGSIKQMAIGVSAMLTEKPSIGSFYKNLFLLYFFFTKSHTVRYYDEAMREIKFCSPEVPTLLLASTNDPMMIPQALEDFCHHVAKTRSVTCKVWQDSEHAQHLRFHPIEYKDLVDGLVKLSTRREIPMKKDTMLLAKL